MYGALLCFLLSPWTNELLKKENNETNRSNIPARRHIILRGDSAIFLLLRLYSSLLHLLMLPGFDVDVGVVLCPLTYSMSFTLIVVVMERYYCGNLNSKQK